jgi:hypothetical protein
MFFTRPKTKWIQQSLSHPQWCGAASGAEAFWTEPQDVPSFYLCGPRQGRSYPKSKEFAIAISFETTHHVRA